MADSDSDSLEFESADEDQNDQDLSDLDIDEILNEDIDLKQPSDTQTKLKQVNIIKPVEEAEEVKTSTNIEPVLSNISETPLELPLEDISAQNEPNTEHPPAESEHKIAEVEGEDEVERILNEMGLDDSNENKLELDHSSQQHKTEIKEAPIKSGWDDTELSDVDESNPIEPEIPVKKGTFEASLNDFNQSHDIEVKIKTSLTDQPQRGWSWSKFGTNFLTSAVNLTSQLGGGINTVLETVEASLGAPDPTELAAKIAKSKSINRLESETQASDELGENNEQNDWNNDDSEWFTLPQLNKLASTGNNIVSGSLDVLESVGKKTIEMINDKDPNFKQTREFLRKVPATIVPIQNKPNLSQLLREAQSQKYDTEVLHSPGSSKNFFERPKQKQEKLNFSLFFDEYKGVAHLEALEMLSRQTSVKIEMLSLEKIYTNDETRDKLNSLEFLFDPDKLNDDYEMEDLKVCEEDFNLLVSKKDKMFDIEHFEFLINDYARRSNLKLVIDKVVGAYRTASYACREDLNPQELFNECIKCFALITANIVEFYHKSAEALLIEQQNMKSNVSNTIENSEILFKITKLFIRSVTILADDYCKKCKIASTSKNSNDKTSSNQVITDIYLEASNSNTYIGDAFLLFLPIFKSQLLDTNDF